MSVYRPKDKNGSFKSSIFHFDFVIRLPGQPKSTRFTGSTGQKTEAAAKKVEARYRELAALGKLDNLLTVDQAAQRYLSEYEPQAPTPRALKQQQLCMAELIRFFGAETSLISITQNDVARAAAERAATPIVVIKRKTMWKRLNGRQKKADPDQLEWASTGKFPKPATVNRQLIEPLRRLLRRARKHWGVPIDLDQFNWGGRDGVLRREPEERVRELSAAEEARFWQALNPAYADLCELFIISGRRQASWLELQKDAVGFGSKTISTRVLKKRRPGTKIVTLTAREREIVSAAIKVSPEKCDYVFTAPSARARDQGARIPISPEMLRRAVKRACKTASIRDFHPHDFRHTFASRGLRRDGSLKKLQEALDHSNIRSTLRYAHVLQDEVIDFRSNVKVKRSA